MVCCHISIKPDSKPARSRLSFGDKQRAVTGPARVEAVSDKKKRHRDELGLQTIKNIINVKNKGGV